MKDFNLATCTKEQLKNKIKRYIGFMYHKKFVGKIFIMLDDQFTKNPTVHFKTNCVEGTTFGILDICGFSKVTIVTNAVWAEYENGIYDEFDNFIDDLYEYIQRTYTFVIL